MVTIIIPSFNEKENVDQLINDILQVNEHGIISRVIYVDDDSSDGTAEYIKSKDFGFPVDCLHRIRRSGLSSAVVEGIMLANTEYVAVMDGDGQHRPTDLLAMIDVITSNQLDLVIGSRFKNCSPDSHVGYRLWLSLVGNKFANKVIGRNISDPLTGFFVMRRSVFMDIAHTINPTGFKILLEILYHCRKKSIAIQEVQINFSKRMAGESKLDSQVMLDFIGQIARCMSGGLIPDKFFAFCFVGLLGIFVHFLILSQLINLSVNFVYAQIVSTLGAMIFNYIINNILTFRRNRRHGVKFFTGMIIFILSCGLGAVANVGVASVINSSGYSWWLSAFAGVIVGTVFNFSLSKSVVWR